MTDTLQMFVDDTPAAAAPVELWDRSTLERYATCPRMAHFVGRRLVSDGSLDADIGNEVHRVLSKAVKARHMDHLGRAELANLIEVEAARSRPDIQPAVIDALRRSYKISWLLCYHSDTSEGRAPEDIIRYDGGDGEFSGQLGADIEVDGKPARLTCEVDLLMATASPRELELDDWKSGWKHWTGGLVEESFQFQFYSYLIFRVFPSIERNSVKVFMTREGFGTSPVYFDRERDMANIAERIASAVRIARRYSSHVLTPGQIAAWPAPARCAICPAAIACADAHKPAADLAKDPQGYLREYMIRSEAVAQMEKNLTAARRQRGSDYVFDGLAFGTEKPPERKVAKRCEFYTV